MADDLGFSDIAPYGVETDTPHVRTLARHGVRLPQFYNTARCCPTCASLLTGLYSHQAAIGHIVSDDGLPGYRGDLSRKCRHHRRSPQDRRIPNHDVWQMTRYAAECGYPQLASAARLRQVLRHNQRLGRRF